ncbi:hypothetical protein [Photobacterium kishitanii]|uniref:hypothetical protein n=1 Tax=Photobacterium kishitanii TaxID=318456 RepID=UPI00071AED48|nr:hypothetical protein [Photobacterium kishitanii]
MCWLWGILTLLIVITVIEFYSNNLQDVAVNVTELCNAICEADLGIVIATGSDFFYTKELIK